MNKILITFSIFLVGCAGSGVKTFVGPSGEVIADVACVTNKKDCFEKAYEYCEGNPYQVNDSWSNAGGLVADWVPGPMTWYHMEISCGQSDGKMPSFAFRGEQYGGLDFEPTVTDPCMTAAGCNGGQNSLMQNSQSVGCKLAAENTIDQFTKVCVYKCIRGTRTKEISGIYSCASTEIF